LISSTGFTGGYSRLKPFRLEEIPQLDKGLVLTPKPALKSGAIEGHRCPESFLKKGAPSGRL
jgi:hypothetical protein